MRLERELAVPLEGGDDIGQGFAVTENQFS